MCLKRCKSRFTFPIAERLAVSEFIFLSAANREKNGWVKDKMLKPIQKLSLVLTFLPSESARPDQITDLIKEVLVYILSCCKIYLLIWVKYND